MGLNSLGIVSDLVREGVEDSVRSQMMGIFSTAELEAANSLQLIILKPDAIATGKSTAILSRLRDAGLVPVYGQLLDHVTSTQFEELYRYNISVTNPRSMIGSIGVSHAGYQLGPAFLLVMSSISANESSPYQVISRMKGPSIPYSGVRGELRFDLGASSRSLNLIHTSDEPISTLREWLIFSDLEAIRQILVSVEDSNRIGLVGARFDECFRYVGYVLHSLGPATSDGDFPEALRRVAGGILLTLEKQNVTARELLSELYDGNIVGDDLVVRLNSIFDRFDRLQEQLKLNCTNDVDQASLMKLFQCFIDFRGLDLPRLTEIFAAFIPKGLSVSKWDRLILESNAHYSGDLPPRGN